MRHPNLEILLMLAFCWGLSCTKDPTNYTEGMTPPDRELSFDQEKWQEKEGKNYPYRDKMLNAIVYNDTIRSLTGKELLEQLGAPSYIREDESYLYYTITQTRLFSWPLHTKTLVIKLTEADSVEWIKIHEWDLVGRMNKI